jgi:hypothetical protein
VSQLAAKDRRLAESLNTIRKAKTLIENKEREVRVIKESSSRKEVMTKLLGTLNPEKQVVMKDLLESVQTAKLQTSFDKYLPAVLNSGSMKQSSKTPLRETVREVTGDKAAIVEIDRDNVIDIKRLAGL